MTQPSTARRPAAKKPSLAASAAAVTKNIIGAVLDKPATVLLPQAACEIHVSPEDFIPAGTIITEEIALEAGLDDQDIGELIDAGHLREVEVHAIAAVAPAEAQG